MQPFIFIERIFLISFIFLKYSVKKTYIDQFGVRQRLDNPIRLRLVFEDVGGHIYEVWSDIGYAF